jgi:hypothetical protein
MSRVLLRPAVMSTEKCRAAYSTSSPVCGCSHLQQELQKTFVVEAADPKPVKRRSTTSYGSLTSMNNSYNLDEESQRTSSYLHASFWPEAGKVMTEEEAKAWDDEVTLIERRMQASMELAQMVQVREEPWDRFPSSRTECREEARSYWPLAQLSPLVLIHPLRRL